MRWIFGCKRSLFTDHIQVPGNECLAVLNNFYNDGVKWHDVTCNHRKPTICEQLRP